MNEWVQISSTSCPGLASSRWKQVSLFCVSLLYIPQRCHSMMSYHRSHLLRTAVCIIWGERHARIVSSTKTLPAVRLEEHFSTFPHLCTPWQPISRHCTPQISQSHTDIVWYTFDRLHPNNQWGHHCLMSLASHRWCDLFSPATTGWQFLNCFFWKCTQMRADYRSASFTWMGHVWWTEMPNASEDLISASATKLCDMCTLRPLSFQLRKGSS